MSGGKNVPPPPPTNCPLQAAPQLHPKTGKGDMKMLGVLVVGVGVGGLFVVVVGLHFLMIFFLNQTFLS